MVILSYIYSFLIAFTLFGIILSFFYHRAFLLTCSYACKEILHDERLLNDEAFPALFLELYGHDVLRR